MITSCYDGRPISKSIQQSDFPNPDVCIRRNQRESARSDLAKLIAQGLYRARSGTGPRGVGAFDRRFEFIQQAA